MTVIELILLLQDRPCDEEVFVIGLEGEFYLVTDVQYSLHVDEPATFITTEEA